MWWWFEVSCYYWIGNSTSTHTHTHPHTLAIEFEGIRVWNYNKSLDDTARGVGYCWLLLISLYFHQNHSTSFVNRWNALKSLLMTFVFPLQVDFIFEKVWVFCGVYACVESANFSSNFQSITTAPGNAHFDFGQTLFLMPQDRLEVWFVVWFVIWFMVCGACTWKILLHLVDVIWFVRLNPQIGSFRSSYYWHKVDHFVLEVKSTLINLTFQNQFSLKSPSVMLILAQDKVGHKVWRYLSNFLVCLCCHNTLADVRILIDVVSWFMFCCDLLRNSISIHGEMSYRRRREVCDDVLVGVGVGVGVGVAIFISHEMIEFDCDWQRSTWTMC